MVLLFHKKDVPGTGQLGGFLNFFHPLSGCTEGVHFDKVGVDGTFSFMFSVEPGTFNEYIDATLLVTTSNAAVVLSSVTDVYKVQGPCSTFTTFREAYAKILPVTNGNVVEHSGQEIILESMNGGTLRYMQFAQDFDSDRPVGVVPEQIRVYIQPEGQSYAGLFTTSGFPAINLARPYYFASTVTHEYGHYTQYTLSTPSMEMWYPSTGQKDFVEGFAEFYQFAVRNYMHDAHDVRFYGYDDNNEESPFSPYYRFQGMSYQGSTSAPGAAAFGCFLWNVYDKYSDAGFEYEDYVGADNDDVGQSTIIFELIESLSKNPQLKSLKI